MPRNNFHRNKPNQYKWRKNEECGNDNHDNYLHRRDQGKTFNRRTWTNNNADNLRRAVEMNLKLTNGSAPMQNGLSLGESWIRITVVNGVNYNINHLQDLINTAIGLQLRFYNCMTSGSNLFMFTKIRQKDFQNHRKALENLRDPLSNTSIITNLTVVPEPRIRPTNGSAQQTLPDDWVEALRRCFVQRFQAANRSLDLSSLHTDPILLSQGLYLPLDKQPVMRALINILKENGAQLAFVNLSSNRLAHLNPFSTLLTTSPGSKPVSIERIDLSANPLDGLPSLAGLRDVPGLVELDITDTPISFRFQSNDKTLCSKLQKILPSIKRVNGQDIEQSVQFAIERNSNSHYSNRPTPKPLLEPVLGYFPNDEVKLALLSFLKIYFTRYDTNPRGENLLPYYTSASQFVLSISTEARISMNHNTTPCARIDSVSESGAVRKIYLTTSRIPSVYLQYSRNLLRCTSETRRRDMVTRGSLNIGTVLSQLPATEHPLESLSVDVAFHSATQLLFTVSGVFYEINTITNQSGSASQSATNSTDGPLRKVLRCFSRTMILVAPGGHVAQDDLIISNPSSALCKKYITEVASRAQFQPSNSSAAGDQRHVTATSSFTSSSTIGATAASSVDNASQNNLVSQFCQRTGMNFTFAKQCLEEYNWEVEVAYRAFETMNAAGKIPAFAFNLS